MAWPLDEARRIFVPNGRPVLFETGYGPSGLPHIGTFTEVLRTTWVKDAFSGLTGLESHLIVFSDDMDGLRLVPDNVPNKDMLKQFIGRPLTNVPDPFGKFQSFAHHNNAMLMKFLDDHGFDYEFASATNYYTSGRFNDALRKVLEKHSEIVDVILPTLGRERAAKYSPLMPIHPITGEVMMVNIDDIDVENGNIYWTDKDQSFTTSVYNGHCKLQWKADWAMRWYALGVDYEMSGKDLIESVKLSSKICHILGGTPPINMTYELFLDEKGQKISKSKGNGVSMEQWLRYGPPESLEHFVFANPQRAKKLFIGMIPKATDEYLDHRSKLVSQTLEQQNENPVRYIHKHIPEPLPITYTLLLNLVSVLNAETNEMVWEYLSNCFPTEFRTSGEAAVLLDTMVTNAITYYKDCVKPKKIYRPPTNLERRGLLELIHILQILPEDADAETIQREIYSIGNQSFNPLKTWFDCLYQVLLGQTEGPRFGMFVKLYGRENVIELIRSKI